ncbi:MAG TPA: NADPH-dependent FMN reductase [bacterium]|nr:NADPH-dependent FMN reductase [bacterium]
MAALRVLGIPGSLRRLSYNRGLLLAAQEVAPAGMAIEIADLAAIPLYNADVEAEGDPPPVQAFKAAIAAADALLIATPEYNHLLSGVLKNAIDWASRPPSHTVLRHKPVAVLGASDGAVGTARAQLALRQTLASTESYVLLRPQVLVANARDRFDASGRLTDERTRGSIRALLDALGEWAERFR